jgi:hypothetical protein
MCTTWPAPAGLFLAGSLTWPMQATRRRVDPVLLRPETFGYVRNQTDITCVGP